jgi:hypothetical protein
MAWMERIKRQPWNKVFVFLKHDEAGVVGPEAAQALLRMTAVSSQGETD